MKKYLVRAIANDGRIATKWEAELLSAVNLAHWMSCEDGWKSGEIFDPHYERPIIVFENGTRTVDRKELY